MPCYPKILNYTLNCRSTSNFIAPTKNIEEGESVEGDWRERAESRLRATGENMASSRPQTTGENGASLGLEQRVRMGNWFQVRALVKTNWFQA